MQQRLTATTPLRYPGAKKKVLRKLLPFLQIEHDEFREPFVGGGAIFFGKPLAPMNWINDLDEDVVFFFLAVKRFPDQLCDLIRAQVVSLPEWDQIKNDDRPDVLSRGFRTLFLNRTNYSGILSANPIGGRAQNKKYPIDCRWNPDLLCSQIMACSRILQDTRISSYDFSEVIAAPPLGRKALIVLDPPYYVKGNSLYRKKMKPEDHERLADQLRTLDARRFNFLLTYDDCDPVRDLYSDWAHIYTEEWFYSTIMTTTGQRGEKGKEVFITNYLKPGRKS